MSLDLTSFESALKQHYTNDRIENMVYKDQMVVPLVSNDQVNFGQYRWNSLTKGQYRGNIEYKKLYKP